MEKAAATPEDRSPRREMPDLPEFENPGARYRMAPLWVWNERMDQETITYQLSELWSRGFGGAFVHPRPGLITPYLSEEWFTLWAYALDEAKRLGMKLYIYDENSYPSGFAGGHVPSRLPDCAARAVSIRYHEGVEDPASLYEDPWVPEASYKRPIRIYAFRRGDGGLVIEQDVTELPDEQWGRYGSDFVALVLEQPEHTPWLGGFAYPDLLRPEVTQLFLETTYEAYYRRFGGDFGDAIPAIFSDEPTLSPGSVFVEDGELLPFSYWFAAQFEQRCGYNLLDHLIWLFADPAEGMLPPQGPDARTIRYDFYTTLHRLWTDNFLKPVAAWCQARNIAWTGHFMEHHWPYPWGQCSPSVMSYYEYMDWPGIDMLMSYALCDSPADPLLLTIREVQSAAAQLGKERVLCEMHGAGGWDTTFEDMKRMGDWLVVNGITFFNPHLTFSSIAGARKRDHPLSFDWRQPWWDDYRLLSDYWARLSYAMSLGQTRHRVLVLHPTTTWYMKKPSEDEGGMLWGWKRVPAASPYRGYVELLQLLSDHQIGYDLGDESILAGHGSVRDGLLQVGQCSYTSIILPEAMAQMCSSTLSLLHAYTRAGGRLLLLGDAPGRVDGRPDEAPQRLLQQPSCKRISRNSLISELQRNMPDAPKLEFAGGAGAPVGLLRRELPEGGDLLFIANHTKHDITGRLTGMRGKLHELDLFTGDRRVPQVEAVLEGDTEVLELRLPPYGSVLLVDDRSVPDPAAPVKPEPAAALPPACASAFPLLPCEVELESANVWMLDYCNLKVGSIVYSSIHTIAATDRIYKHHGLPGNPWDRQIQFQDRYLHYPSFPEGSGFEAAFAFEVQDIEAARGCRLAVERAAYYELSVNGQPVSWEPDSSWLDRHTGLASIGHLLQQGANEICLAASPFRLDLELEPLYLLGSFGLAVENEQFMMVGAPSLDLGSLAQQGYPFYGDVAVYRHLLPLERLPQRVEVELQDWQGTACALRVNGSLAGYFGVGKGGRVDITPYLRVGGNEIDIRLAASLKNVLGPHHDPGKPRRIAWPAHWKIAPQRGPVPAKAYDFIDYGIHSPLLVYINS